MQNNKKLRVIIIEVMMYNDRDEMRVLRGIAYMLNRIEPRTYPGIRHRKGDVGVI